MEVERGISEDAVIDAIMQGDVIMHYHNDKPFPRWLVYNNDNASPLHVVVSTDGMSAYMITAYVPTFEDWENNYFTRKG